MKPIANIKNIEDVLLSMKQQNVLVPSIQSNIEKQKKLFNDIPNAPVVDSLDFSDKDTTVNIPPMLEPTRQVRRQAEREAQKSPILTRLDIEKIVRSIMGDISQQISNNLNNIYSCEIMANREYISQLSKHSDMLIEDFVTLSDNQIKLLNHISVYHDSVLNANSQLIELMNDLYARLEVIDRHYIDLYDKLSEVKACEIVGYDIDDIIEKVKNNVPVVDKMSIKLICKDNNRAKYIAYKILRKHFSGVPLKIVDGNIIYTALGMKDVKEHLSPQLIEETTFIEKVSFDYTNKIEY